MFKYLCNRCRAEINEPAINKITISRPMYGTVDVEEPRGTYALCRDCTDKLKRWIEGRPEP